MTSVLYVAAHPDDEDTQLITYLARGRGSRTAYLSLTRGDGGQNLLGPHLRDELGVLRTQELLAARRVDGGRQFFTRAKDFGFSKDPAETLSLWDRSAVLADMVRVIRSFRPDVVITAFSPTSGGTHGHHTASAMLAVEAFKLAGDPSALREQLSGLPAWQPKRMVRNARGAGTNNAAPLRMDVGGYNALLGESYGEIAARSRSMHKTQGFGTLASRGVNERGFELLAGAPATGDLFEGVDTRWSRIRGGEKVDRLIENAIERFDARDPGQSVPALLEIRRSLGALADDPLVADKRAQLDAIVAACLGLYWETTAESAEIVPGETLNLRHAAIVRSNAMLVRWVAVRYPSLKAEIETGVDLAADQTEEHRATQTLPGHALLSHPYWLRAEASVGMFAVDDSGLIGRAENPPVLPVEQVFQIQGETLVFADEPVQVVRDPAAGEVRRRLQVIAPVTLEFGDDVELFTPGGTRSIAVTIHAARAPVSGQLRLEAPAGWQVTPPAAAFEIGLPGDRRQREFKITAPAKPAVGSFGAVAKIGNVEFRSGRIDINYPHLPQQLLQPGAHFKAIGLSLATRGHRVGYIAGAGDAVADSLERMGYEVTLLAVSDLRLPRLQEFDAIICGVRAFNTRSDLVSQLPTLLAYVEAGGTMVAQYNTQDAQAMDALASIGLQLSRDRVTDERAAVTMLAPSHPALSSPNKIGPADFEAWVQERGLYYPQQWDATYTALIAANDRGESPKAGGLLIAKRGRGHLAYTSLSFFRQLPEGVPGAYRLFANLVSLGK